MRGLGVSTALQRAGVCCLALLLTGCVTLEPRPAGISRSIFYSVTPVYPRSFDIVAAGPRRREAAELRDAWQAKAAMVANGRRFKASPLVVRDTEYIPSGYGAALPIQRRTVTGTMTLVE